MATSYSFITHPTPAMDTSAGAPSDPLPDEEAKQLMETLLDPESEALQTVLESGDERFVSVLLELMRARQIGIVDGSYSDIIKALEGLSGQDFGQDWPAWVEWYGTTELEPPPGTPLPSTACTGALDRSPIPMAARYGLSTVARRLFRPGGFGR